jgi:hypothetical protein
VAVYGILVVTATSYLSVVAILGPAYATFMNVSAMHALFINPAAPLTLFSLAAWAALRRSRTVGIPWSLLATVVVATYAAGVLQDKGFRYHYYPAFALAMVLVGWLAIVGTESTPGVRLYRRITPLLAATIGLVVCGHAVVEAVGWDRRRLGEVRGLAELEATIRARSQGRPVGVLSYSVDGAFPLVNEIQGTLALRLPSLWPLAASYWNELRTGGPLRYREVGEMPPAERYMWDAVREDLTRRPPGVLLVLTAGQDVPGNGLRRLNYVAYFARDPVLRRLFQQYQLVGASGEYFIYERLDGEADRIGPPPSVEPLPRVAPRLGLGDFTAAMIDPTAKAGLLTFVLLWLGTAGWRAVRTQRKHSPAPAAARELPRLP